MIVNPAVIALVGGGLFITAFALYALASALGILKDWDLGSGSERQLILEKRTYLVTTLFSYLLAFELFSLILFLYTAEHLHGLFVGAMCAAGSLAVNGYGYPALVVKCLVFLFGGVWLVVNHVDNQAPDYPLIRTRYRLLVILVLLMVLGTGLQTAYFAGLRADVITSCCGTLFSGERGGLAADIASLPLPETRIAFYLTLLLTVRVGLNVFFTGRGAAALGLLAAAAAVVSIASVIAFVSVYYYKLPSHHCPFCLLQGDYGHVGYPLYLSLFTGAITGIGTGVLEALKGPVSLTVVIPTVQRRLSLISVAAFLVFALLSTWPMVFTDFVP